MNTLNKLTLKNLKLNKSRTIVTIIGILLSTALITVVAGIAASGQQTMINAEINFSGDYDLSLSGNITDKDVKEISTNRNVESVYIEDNSGVAQMPTYKNETRPYAYIQALSAQAFTDCFNLPLESGRYPQNSSELLLTQTFVLNSAQKYEIGDTITLELGERKTADGESIIDVSNYNKTYKINENGEAETIDCEED